MHIPETLAFDDVLLVPKNSEIQSRSEVNLSVVICKGLKFDHPIIPANMKSIVGPKLVREVYQMQGLVLLHRFNSMKDQFKHILCLQEEFGDRIFDYIGVSVGVKKEDYKNVKIWYETGIKIICVDIAHLDSTLGLQMVRHIANNYPKILLIAGNVATKDAAIRAWKSGADIVKIGIGSGSICSTRIATGCGVAQLSAIMEIAEVKKDLEKELDRKLYTISDGGHKQHGDCGKALCFTDFVMLGNMLAGATETPGNVIEINGQKLKEYSGSSTLKTNRVEGYNGAVRASAPVREIMKKLLESLQSCCSYQNCRNVKDLQNNPQLRKITHSGWKESGAHDIIVLG
jgi:IMP dehydrogenase